MFFDALISTLPRCDGGPARCDGGPELRSPAADGGRDPEREPTEGRAAAPGGGFLRTAVDGFRGGAAVAAFDGLRGAGAAAAADGLRAAVAVDGLRAAVDDDDATEAPRDGARAADDAAERADGLPVEPHVSDSASLFACGDVARGAADDDAPPPGFTDGRRPPAGAVAPTLLRRRSGDAPLDATELPLGRRWRAGVVPPGAALGRRAPFGGSAAVGMEPELGLRSRCGVPAAHVADFGSSLPRRFFAAAAADGRGLSGDDTLCRRGCDDDDDASLHEEHAAALPRRPVGPIVRAKSGLGGMAVDAALRRPEIFCAAQRRFHE